MMDLEHELGGLPGAIHFEALKNLGVPPKAIGQLGAAQSGVSIAMSRIEPLSGGLYQPNDEGMAALLIAVCDEPSDVLHPILDIIAVRSPSPARWWWRSGLAGMLGQNLIENDMGNPVKVVSTPIEWLAEAGRAVCVLDWSTNSPAWTALRHGPALTFSNDGLRQKVRNALISTTPLPDMEIAA